MDSRLHAFGARRRARLLATASMLALGLTFAFSGPAARAERGEKPVTWEDIANDDKSTSDVLSYGLGLHANRFSTLDKINVDTVGKLKAKWAFSFGDERQRGQEGQALVHDGVIYITGSYSRMFALDAKTGKRLWAYSHRLAEDIRPCCDVVNRGAAIYGDKIYMGTLDAGIVALNRKTGKVAWQKKFEDHTAGYTMTGAPAIIKDQKTGRVMLIHGSSGDEFGVVGRLYARDPDTGEEIWMRPLVEGHMGRLNGQESTPTGDPKAPSWPNNPDGTKKDSWNHGGGAPWQTATFDVKSNTIVIGTGNPAPWNYHYRSGPNGDWKPYDSLYTSGQVYIEPSTGEPVGFFQHTPNDAWDFSGNNSVLLFDLEKNGKKTRAAAHADRNGFFFVTDLDKLTARDGRISKQAGGAIGIYPFVRDISWASGWDLATGRPKENNDRPPAPAEGEKQGNARPGDAELPRRHQLDADVLQSQHQAVLHPVERLDRGLLDREHHLQEGRGLSRPGFPHQAQVRGSRRRPARHRPGHRKDRLGSAGAIPALGGDADHQGQSGVHRHVRRFRQSF